MIDRLELIMKAENLSQTQFAEEIDINKSSMSHIMNGRNNPSLDFVTHILNRFPNIQSDWLLFGKGTMYKDKDKDKEEQQQNLDLFNQTDLKDKEIEELKLKIVEFKELIYEFNNKITSLKEDKQILLDEIEKLKSNQHINHNKDTVKTPLPPITKENEVTSIITLYTDKSFDIYKQNK